jgi:hypothetical protein
LLLSVADEVPVEQIGTSEQALQSATLAELTRLAVTATPFPSSRCCYIGMMDEHRFAMGRHARGLADQLGQDRGLADQLGQTRRALDDVADELSRTRRLLG